MCDFAKINENNVYICEYTKSLCTLCVLGNGKTYKEAVKAAEKGE